MMAGIVAGIMAGIIVAGIIVAGIVAGIAAGAGVLAGVGITAIITAGGVMVTATVAGGTGISVGDSSYPKARPQRMLRPFSFPTGTMLTLAMTDEIASAELQRLLGINKSVLNELAKRGIVKRGTKRGAYLLQERVLGYCDSYSWVLRGR